jgi:sugar lactone lactonase YvrE
MEVLMMRDRFVLLVSALALTTLLHIRSLSAAEETAKPGTLLTVAGTGALGFSGDGGPALQATLAVPRGVAVDAAGNLYIVEELNEGRVRKVAPDGTITTVAGGPKPAEGIGDGGPATAALLNTPHQLALDGTGNLYIAEFNGNRVRKVSPDGIITTVAGTGKDGFSGDGGPATEARLDHPFQLVVDAAGNLFIADAGGGRVRKVSPEGIITTVAGGGEPADGVGDGGPATAAALYFPEGLAIDEDGNLFIAEYGDAQVEGSGNRVRKVSPDGTITTCAGTGEAGFSGDGGKATEARIDRPIALAVDTDGNLLISDWGNYRVRKVSPDGIITTVAGSDKKTFAGEGGPATEAGLRGPAGLAIDAAGSLFIPDSGAFRDDELGDAERVVKVVAVAAPGLIAGKPFPQPAP